MAANFTIVSTRPNTQLIGGTQVQQGISVGFVTIPNGVWAEVFVSQQPGIANIAKAAAMGYATILETLFTLEWVIGVSWSQRVNPSNLLIDQVTIVVSSSSGNSSDLLTVDVSKLGPRLHEPQIEALHEQLDELEAA